MLEVGIASAEANRSRCASSVSIRPENVGTIYGRAAIPSATPGNGWPTYAANSSGVMPNCCAIAGHHGLELRARGAEGRDVGTSGRGPPGS